MGGTGRGQNWVERMREGVDLATMAHARFYPIRSSLSTLSLLRPATVKSLAQIQGEPLQSRRLIEEYLNPLSLPKPAVLHHPSGDSECLSQWLPQPGGGRGCRRIGLGWKRDSFLKYPVDSSPLIRMRFPHSAFLHTLSKNGTSFSFSQLTISFIPSCSSLPPRLSLLTHCVYLSCLLSFAAVFCHLAYRHAREEGRESSIQWMEHAEWLCFFPSSGSVWVQNYAEQTNDPSLTSCKMIRMTSHHVI